MSTRMNVLLQPGMEYVYLTNTSEWKKLRSSAFYIITFIESSKAETLIYGIRNMNSIFPWSSSGWGSKQVASEVLVEFYFLI